MKHLLQVAVILVLAKLKWLHGSKVPVPQSLVKHQLKKTGSDLQDAVFESNPPQFAASDIRKILQSANKPVLFMLGDFDDDSALNYRGYWSSNSREPLFTTSSTTTTTPWFWPWINNTMTSWLLPWESTTLPSSSFPWDTTREPLFTTPGSVFPIDSDSREPLFTTSTPSWIFPPYYTTLSSGWTSDSGEIIHSSTDSDYWDPTKPPLLPPRDSDSRETLFPTSKKRTTKTLGSWLPNARQVLYQSEQEESDESAVALRESKSSADSGEMPSNGIQNTLGMISALTYPNQDFVCSPVCSMMPLGKLALGAGGKTANELYNALGVSGPDEIATVFRQTIKELQFIKGVSLNMASAIFVAPDITIDTQYEQLVKTVFKNSVMGIKSKDPIGAANEINRWVSKETNGKINNVIMSNQLPRTTKIVLINAISFHGTWKHKFGKPEPMTFHSPDGDKQIPFISVKGSYRHTFAENLHSEIISIPYFDTTTFMVILLPKTDTGVPHVLEIAKKNPTMIHEVIKKAPTAHNLYVSIPKFKIQSPVNLETVYKKLKINRIFKPKKKSFEAICPNKDVYVTAAVQKAIFEVTEEGKEGGGAASSKQTTDGFVANRPFHFVVYVNGKELISGQFYGTSVF